MQHNLKGRAIFHISTRSWLNLSIFIDFFFWKVNLLFYFIFFFMFFYKSNEILTQKFLLYDICFHYVWRCLHNMGVNDDINNIHLYLSAWCKLTLTLHLGFGEGVKKNLPKVKEGRVTKKWPCGSNQGPMSHGGRKFSCCMPQSLFGQVSLSVAMNRLRQ